MAQRSGHQEALAEILEAAGIKPIETVEADHEKLMRALVAAGVGVGLIRKELALEVQTAGEVILFGDHRATTNLAFAYPEVETIRQSGQLAALKKTWSIER